MPCGVSHSNILKATVPKTFAAKDRWSLLVGRSRSEREKSELSGLASVASSLPSVSTSSPLLSWSGLARWGAAPDSYSLQGFDLHFDDLNDPWLFDRFGSRGLSRGNVPKMRFLAAAGGVSLGIRNDGQSPFSGLSRPAR